MSAKPKKPMAKLSEGEANPPADKKVKDPVLAEFIAIFGPEKGIDLWQSDTDIEEVRQWKTLNEKYGVPEPASAGSGTETLADDEDNPNGSPSDKKEKPAADPPKGGEPEPKDKEEKLSAVLTKLNKTLEAQNAEIVKLKAAIPKGEATPVSHGYSGGKEEPPKAKNSVAAYAERYKK